jgi:DNA-binding winged helix-turn-helix (wHTH) protein
MIFYDIKSLKSGSYVHSAIVAQPKPRSAAMSRPSVLALESTTGATTRKNVLSFGPFSLFAAERLLKKADEPIPLGGRALDILIALTQRAGEVVSHKELISSAWPDLTVEGANLRVHIAALRKALGDGIDGARYISTVVSRGYCFVAPVTRSTSSSIWLH